METQRPPVGPAAPGVGRRTIPLREIRLPHRCPLPVRMHVLSRVPYFEGLTETDLGCVDDLMQARSYAAGDPVYRAGDRADALYVVAEGRVRLTQLTLDGAETVTDILVPGELFGAMDVLGEPHHLHSASAMVGTCALRIGQSDFRRVLATSPGVALRVLDDVAARLVRAQSDVSDQATGTVARRVATALLRLSDKLGVDRGDRGTMLEVPLSRSDLAGLARSTPESVSRVMSRWKREGVIASGRRWTAVLDRNRLVEEAAGIS